ncbi:NifB/NifX family molybdenum-iron cluster-binding protein [Caldivirga sp.]|uniref:NifB/NifX family molybdenum-iron cluster-binding protein n=1 Tax=Caldivirga sp. TaxID=2080243 RepID=UPI0025BC22B5|nr:NifB/NifX family molybdenum-iron cluster-binding protein [Caldivirga sp.]
MIRIALCTNDGKTISDGHFAHAKRYVIYDYDEETGNLKHVETRDNPLGNVADLDDPEAIHSAMSEIGVPMHGVEKYEWLRNNVLNDVNIVIASGACPLSHSYFTSMGVQLVFVEPNTQIDLIIDYLKEIPNERNMNELE